MNIYQIIPVMAITALVTAIVIIAATYIMVNKKISRPLRTLAEKSDLLTLVGTDIEIEEECLKRSDEIGVIGRAIINISKDLKRQSGLLEVIFISN